MANQRINRVLRRRPEIDEAEFELLQARVVARLSKVDPELPIESGDPDRATGPTETTEAVEAAAVFATTGVDALSAERRFSASPAVAVPSAGTERAQTDMQVGPGQVTTPERSDPGVRIIAMPRDAARDEVPFGPDANASEVAADAAPIDVPASDGDSSGKQAKAIARPRPKRAPRRPAVPVMSPAAPKPVAASPYCPYCALLLDPPPEVSRRCSRCRERIVVKRIDGRAVYLTEASVAVFEGERKRMAHVGRWTKERGRWLTLAAAAGAPADRIKRLQAAPLSDDAVEAAHSLYTTTVDRSFRTAKRERRWEDASRIMREHARVLYRIAGSPIPPPEDSIRAHRVAATAALHGIGEIAREAELVSAKCCDACRADDGRTFRIAQELRVPRLPHAGCPKGLCRCDWYLAVRDESAVRRHLRRRARADTSATSRSA